MTGTLALVGGGEFTAAAREVDLALVKAARGHDVLVLPTAAAYEHPQRAVANAIAWFADLGLEARGLDVLTRPDAFNETHVRAARESAFTYIAGGSPMHLKSVLKETPLWEAIVAAEADGGVLAGSSAGAMVLTDPMTDPRGGAFTLGLGLVPQLSVVPHAEQWSGERLHRTVKLATGFTLVTLHTGSAVVRTPAGTWEAYGNVTVYIDRTPVGLDALP